MQIRMWGRMTVVCGVSASLALLGCRVDSRAPAANAAAAAKAADPHAWAALPVGNDPFSVEVRHGRALMDATHDSLPAFARSALRCSSCHLDGGTGEVLGLRGVYARFPQYRERNASVVVIQDRVNDCFQRSLAGKTLPDDTPQMKAIISYLAWLSRDVPGTPSPEPSHLGAEFKTMAWDTAAGRGVYELKCAACHGADGNGTAVATPVWGPRSFSIGATMARNRSAAAFIQANMPRGAGGTLTAQEALNVAAYVNAHSRPDLPGKENDWPHGGAPADVPYRTHGSP